MPILDIDDDRLILRFYEAAADESRWKTTLGILADAMAADEATFSVWPRRPEAPMLVVSSDRLFDERAITRYNAHYYALDAARNYVAGQPDTRIYSCAEFISPDVVRRSEYYQDFIIPCGGRYLMGGCVAKREERAMYVALHRGGQRGPFERADIDRLSRIVPHLRQAGLLYAEMARLKQEKEEVRRVIDALRIGVIVVDSECRVLFANTEATALLERGDGLQVRRGRLVTADHSRTAVLTDGVRAAAAVGAKGRRHAIGAVGRALAIPRNPGRSPLLVRVLPLLPEIGSALPTSSPSACLFITDTEKRGTPPGSVFVQMFDLTPAEARLAVELASGAELRDIAETRGTAISTLRTQVSQILCKTETRRQSELLKLIGQLTTAG